MTKTKPATRRMTAEAFIRNYGDKSGYELVLGRLVELPMPGLNHGEISGNAYFIVREFVKKRNLGRVAINDTFIRVHDHPPSYRGADVLYISYKALPKKISSTPGPLEVPPDLVVEVRSPSDRMKDVLAKGQEYLLAGVKVVVIIDPETESLGVFRLDELPHRFHNGDTVTISDVLPGFAVPARAFFE